MAVTTVCTPPCAAPEVITLITDVPTPGTTTVEPVVEDEEE